MKGVNKMNKGNKVIGDKKQEISGKITSAVTLSGVSPKSPYGFFASAQNDTHGKNCHCEKCNDEAIQNNF